MDSLPSARKCMSSSHSCLTYPIYPASIKTDEDRPHPGDRFGRRDDFSSSRRKLLILRFVPSYRFTLRTADRSFASPREDLPLPTQPPYTAYVANLAFDITEGELESFFGPHEVCCCGRDIQVVI